MDIKKRLELIKRNTEEIVTLEELEKLLKRKKKPDVKNFEIVKGSDFQLKKEYISDVLKMSTFTTVRDCNKAASEVVKFGDNPKLSGLIYPIKQSLDEVYLKVDVQYGGLDQRKILMFARENLPKIGYERKSEIKTPNIPGLVEGGKKSS